MHGQVDRICYSDTFWDSTVCSFITRAQGVNISECDAIRTHLCQLFTGDRDECCGIYNDPDNGNYTGWLALLNATDYVPSCCVDDYRQNLVNQRDEGALDTRSVASFSSRGIYI